MQEVFAIFKQTASNQYRFTGNGFFINNDGSFVTAGHVLKEECDYFIGFIGFPEVSNNFELYSITNTKVKYKKLYGEKNI